MDLELARRHTMRFFSDGFFLGAANFANLLPLSHARYYGVKKVKNVPYVSDATKDQLLDIYIPQGASKALPVVLYIHGGGFHLCSKDTHKIFALQFARQGYLVCNINYRLAPQHPFPAAIEDVCQAYVWVVENIAKYGGDPQNIVVGGESAGGNLTLSLGIAACLKRPESYAQAVFDLNVVPRSLLPLCGLLQVSDMERYAASMRKVYYDIARFPNDEYLPPSVLNSDANIDLADPIVLLEQMPTLNRPFPPVFAGVGTADPIMEDTQRLESVLEKMKVPAQVKYYSGGIHAFQAFIFTSLAKRHWHDLFHFLRSRDN